MAFSVRLRELMKKYGKVAIGVHLSVSATSIAGLYIAIKNNVDVESIFEKVGLHSGAEDKIPSPAATYHGSGDPTAAVLDDYGGVGSSHPPQDPAKARNKTMELAKSSGGALALAILCNKALFPIRVPITIALTPPVARFLAKRNLLKTNL